MSSGIERREASPQAERLLQGVDEVTRELLAADPLETLRELYGMGVTLRSETEPQAGSCSVDGSYFPGKPPRITVARSLSVGRQHFTALHEFGHHLIHHDPELADTSWERGAEQTRRLVEEIANSVAAQLLLPDYLVDAHIGGRGPTARSVAELRRESNASRAACCVRATERLRSSGCVMLGTSSIAEFTAHRATPWWVARGVDQGSGSLLAHALQSGGARGPTRVRFATGTQSTALHGDAYAADDGWVYAVIVTERAPWGGLSVIDTDDRPIFEARHGECLVCDGAINGKEQRCQTCGGFICRRCRKCPCAVAERPERQCDACFLVKRLSQFTGPSTTCTECVGE